LSKDLVQSLLKMGWTPSFKAHLDNLNDGTLVPARVVGVRKNSFYVSQGKGEWPATAAGRLNHQIDGLYPVAGDWVLIADTVIYRVLPRKNALSRGAAGTHGQQNALPTREQVIAANLDTVFVVCGLDRDFNLRRIERLLTLTYNCGLNPVIILTKADLHRHPETFLSQVEAVAFGVPVHLISATDSFGLAQLGSISIHRPDHNDDRIIRCRQIHPGESSLREGRTGGGPGKRTCGQREAYHHQPRSDSDTPGGNGDRQSGYPGDFSLGWWWRYRTRLSGN
jgi:hypothetical protein